MMQSPSGKLNLSQLLHFVLQTGVSVIVCYMNCLVPCSLKTLSGGYTCPYSGGLSQFFRRHLVSHSRDGLFHNHTICCEQTLDVEEVVLGLLLACLPGLLAYICCLDSTSLQVINMGCTHFDTLLHVLLLTSSAIFLSPCAFGSIEPY